MLLFNHTSPETAYVVDDYPYGFKLRCKIRYWIEKATKGKCAGQYRFCSQTLNPKTGNWNKPKYSVYTAWMCLEKDDQTGYISNKAIGYHSQVELINKFLEENKLPDEDINVLEKLIQSLELLNKLDWIIFP